MTKLATTASILICTLTAFADPPQATDISNDKVAITEGGLRKGQNNLRNQTVSTGDRASDAKFQIQTLQRKANAATSTLSHEQKAELFDLGSEILPFVAPYINEIAESCIKKIDFNSAAAEAKAGECTKQAVSQFQANPTAFLERLPASEKQRLEALIQQRVKESIKSPTPVRP